MQARIEISTLLRIKPLPSQKKNPEARILGAATGCCLKLVGSSVRAAMGCRGMGDRRPDRPTKQKIGRISLNTTSHQLELFAIVRDRKLGKRTQLSDCAVYDC